MAVVEINEKLTEIDERVRIEQGPIRKTATATEGLLATGATAEQYQVGNRDANGKIIVMGESMTYLDWLAEPGYYVYELGEATHLDDAGVEHTIPAWLERSCHITRDAAVAAADVLIAAGS